MRNITRPVTLIAIASACAGAVAIGGIAYAGGATPAATVHACVGKHRVLHVSPCASGEQALNWNQRGPKGKTGSQGPTGLTGPSHAFNVALTSGPLPATASTVLTTLLLPGGLKYIASAHVTISTTAAMIGTCSLKAGTTVIATTGIQLDASTQAPMYLAGTAEPSGASAFTVSCQQTTGTGATMTDGNLTVIEIGGLN